MTNNTQSTQPHMVWELVRLAGARSAIVICSVEQTMDEYEVNGRADALASLLPLVMIDSANSGEWNEEGLIFTHEGRTYLVRCRRVEREVA
jgi:hypothetical protein